MGSSRDRLRWPLAYCDANGQPSARAALDRGEADPAGGAAMGVAIGRQLCRVAMRLQSRMSSRRRALRSIGARRVRQATWVWKLKEPDAEGQPRTNKTPRHPFS